MAAEASPSRGAAAAAMMGLLSGWPGGGSSASSSGQGLMNSDTSSDEDMLGDEDLLPSSQGRGSGHRRVWSQDSDGVMQADLRAPFPFAKGPAAGRSSGRSKGASAAKGKAGGKASAAKGGKAGDKKDYNRKDKSLGTLCEK